MTAITELLAVRDSIEAITDSTAREVIAIEPALSVCVSVVRLELARLGYVEDEDNGCEGHADGPVMGETFYCDGSCQVPEPVSDSAFGYTPGEDAPMSRMWAEHARRPVRP